MNFDSQMYGALSDSWTVIIRGEAIVFSRCCLCGAKSCYMCWC